MRILYLPFPLMKVSGSEDNLSTLFPLEENILACQDMKRPLRTVFFIKNNRKDTVNK